MSNKETAFANHVLASIKKDLDFLKQQQYLTPAAYEDIKRNLPNTITATPAAAASPASRAVPSPPSYNNAAPNSLATAEALYDFNGPNPQDLSFRQGEIIQVTEYVNNDWWRGTLNGRTGLFPSNYVQKKETPAAATPPPPPPATPPRQNTNQSYGGYPPAPQEKGFNGGSPYSAPGGYSQPPPAYPAPQAASYATPPPQAQAYATPPPQPSPYAAPPVQPAPSAAPAAGAPPPAHQEEGGSKFSGMLGKVGSNVANAATWGFGATLGSEAAQSIF
ncbi:SH3-domain-containing protein [Lichtheimia hyalospora FSU 10163]|nr:SH3-domain-containing protein [Lichtheimia hyalospora FSU 10163]